MSNDTPANASAKCSPAVDRVCSMSDSANKITFGDGSTLVLEPRWRHVRERGIDIIESPEQVLRMFLLSGPEEQDDEAAIHDAWLRVRPDFSLKPYRSIRPPTPKVWERWHNVYYDLPAAAGWTASANLRAFRGRSYITLTEGPDDVMDRREAQLIAIFQSWQPAGFERKNLDKRALREFSPAEFESFVTSAMTKLQVPGVSIAVLLQGKVVLSGAYGVKALGKAERIDRDTRFLIGSTTKPLTTLMMAQLVDQKILDWDEPIAAKFPEFILGDPELTSRLSFRLSVSATTGMPRRDMEFMFRGRHISAEQLLASMKSMTPTTGLGETFQYSNLMVAAGGYAAARAYCPDGSLNLAYAKAMSELVFGPLGMTASSITGTDPLPDNRAMPHGRDLDWNMVPISLDFVDAVHSNTPAGAAWSTAEDLARYVQLELNRGVAEDGTRRVAEQPLLARRTPGIKMDRDTHYGLGLMVENYRGITVVQHGGSILGFDSDLLFVPEAGSGLILLTNAASGYELEQVVRAKFFEMLFGDDADAEKIINHLVAQRIEQSARFCSKVSIDAKDTDWLGEWRGRYRNPDLGALEVKRMGDQYLVASESWTLRVASRAEDNGEKTIIVVEPPFKGLRFIPRKLGEERTLVIDDAQVTYEFLRV